MLFHVLWEFIDTTEDGERRSLEVFSQWQPPEGAEFRGFYGFTDGTGGVAIIEADSAATLARTTDLHAARLPGGGGGAGPDSRRRRGHRL